MCVEWSAAVGDDGTRNCQRPYIAEEGDPLVNLIFSPYSSRVVDQTAEAQGAVGTMKDW